MLTYTNFLKHVKNLIKKGWCQGHYATDNYGKSVLYEEKNACKFCLVGALMRTQRDFELGVVGSCYNDKFQHFLWEKGIYNILHFNDDVKTTKKKVLSWLDSAIKNR